MAAIMDLMRMPEQAKRMRSYEPKPDPIQQQLQQLELQKLMLELEKLKADIHDKHARANENEIDAELKRNKAAVEAAKARKLGSEADMTDLKFLKEDNEYDREVENEKFEKQRLHDLDMVTLQKMAGDSNIGMPR